MAISSAESARGGILQRHRSQGSSRHAGAEAASPSPYLYGLGLCLVIIGLARPQAGKAESRISGEGIAIEIVLDVSGSMEALDFQLEGREVSRLEAVKHVIQEFVLGSRSSGLSGRTDDLIGLVAFGGFADSKCPLTLDHGALIDIVQGLQIPRPIRDAQGRVINAQALQEEFATAIGDGVAVGVDRLRGAKAKSKAENAHLDLQSRGCFSLGHVVPSNLQGLKDHPATRPRYMGKEAVLDRIVLGAVGRVVGDPDLDA